MKKFKFTIHGNEYDVEILNVEGSTAELEVNGTKYAVEVEKKMARPITPKLVRQQVSPSTDMHKSERKTTASPSEKGGTVKAPLPGTVLNVLTKVGDQVKVGDQLLVLEAMKMENNIKADRAGTVKSVLVNAGDSVMEGDPLVEIGG